MKYYRNEIYCIYTQLTRCSLMIVFLATIFVWLTDYDKQISSIESHTLHNWKNDSESVDPKVLEFFLSCRKK